MGIGESHRGGASVVFIYNHNAYTFTDTNLVILHFSYIHALVFDLT